MIAPALFAVVSLVRGPDPAVRAAASAAAAVQAVAAPGVSGVVRDATGGVVAGAVVLVRSGVAESRGTTDAAGRFTIECPRSAAVEVIVRAAGFAEGRVTVAPSTPAQDLNIVLAAAPLSEAVTVTATRDERRVDDVPASVTVLGAAEIRQSPAVVADDLLRQVPTFSLFRRTSSLASHPTAQGVSLRGIGPSGVSRTLVLLDGVPFNDPFGGWVYWSRVPLAAADRIEIVDGASSSLYGNYAMGGVINILTTPPARRTASLDLQYGSRSSPKAAFTGSDVFGKLGVAVDLTGFDTDGYPPVAANERGAVDNNAAVRFGNMNVRLNYTASDRLTAFLRAGYFKENRDNGKASTINGQEEANDTTWKSVSGGIRARLPDASQLDATVFVDDELFHSNFLAVPAATPARSFGRMTLLQTVPTHGVGASVQWMRAIGTTQVLSTGVDWRWVDGDSHEQGLDTQRGEDVTLDRVSGGTQQSTGIYVQDVITPVQRLVLTLGARVDHWRNYDGHNLEHSVPSGVPTANDDASLADRTDTTFSPHVAARYHLTDRTSVWGGLSWGFRAPTLNELYRQFRVGAVLTLANNQLGPERLTGGEGGITVTPFDRLTWRTTGFVDGVRDPVANVTISPPGGSVVQQRQNLGRTRIWGIQTDVDWQVSRYVRASAAYLFNQAKVTEIPQAAASDGPSLVGNFLPQVPQHRASFEVTYANPRVLTFTVGIQGIGRQFDDDQNIRTVPGETTPGLPGYGLLNLTAMRDVGRHLQVYVSAQNLLDEEYVVGTLPTTLGSPRLVSAGVRVNWAGR
jgi:outer membrane receptor protein involved in Fe transport